MRQAALNVIEKLGLNYVVTLVSAGGTGRTEIVMWDRPRDSYFSIRIISEAGRLSPEMLAETIESQLRERLATLKSGDEGGFGERRPYCPGLGHDSTIRQ